MRLLECVFDDIRKTDKLKIHHKIRILTCVRLAYVEFIFLCRVLWGSFIPNIIY